MKEEEEEKIQPIKREAPPDDVFPELKTEIKTEVNEMPVEVIFTEDSKVRIKVCKTVSISQLALY